MKSFFLRVWMGWERLFEKIFGIVYISDDNIFRVALRVYRGKAIQLSDGTVLRGGDKYIELHFNNQLAMSVLKDVNPMAMLNWARSSLIGLARFIKEGPYAKADVIMGLTIFSLKSIERFGFEIMELNRVERRIVSLYERFL
ncbi:YkoP family protein [Caldanaerobius polysaccharolyticus]|uniref:YkoP family protein n=1 Tax=Caldanaerobius polysaccharolyticus TaxID=44256 RepID=UPI00047BDC6D|nr:hypothetical protein [Caldanaerobius polysaccharolyticus]